MYEIVVRKKRGLMEDGRKMVSISDGVVESILLGVVVGQKRNGKEAIPSYASDKKQLPESRSTVYPRS